MPTVVKNFVFASDAEGLADAGNHANIAFAFQGADGNPASGCVAFTTSTNSLNNAKEYARRATVGQTWADWGVPAGSTVTHAQITDWRAKVANDAGLDNATLKARIVDSLDLPICSDLLNHDLVPYTGAWEDKAAGTQQAIDSDSQSTSQDVRLELEFLVRTQIAGTNVDIRFDSFELTITYDEGSGGVEVPAVPISNLDGLVFMKGFAYASRGAGFQDTIGMAALQECSIQHSYSYAEARGPESLQPLGVGVTEEMLTGSIRHMVFNTEQLVVFLGGTASYSGGTGKTTFTKLIDQEPNPFNLRLKTPEDGSDMEILVYQCLCQNQPIIEGSANRDWKVFGVDWRAYGQSTSGGKKLFEVIVQGNQTGSS